MLPKYIKTAEDLQTKHSDIRDGFLNQALLKTDRAAPYVEKAKRFYAALNKCRHIKDIIKLNIFRVDLISACGFSEKAKSKMSEKELDAAILKVLSRIIKKAKDDFREEILYRYLLTKGDTLGGSMRNLTGSYASIKLIYGIINCLKKRGNSVKIVKSKAGKIQRLHWEDKILVFDATPPIIGKNIDVILLRNETKKGSEQELFDDQNNYIACGELKGGIDPAGADEHWKTANSALGRIRAALEGKRPKLFFVAAAIEASMAKEIFNQLVDERLNYAANLNNDAQIEDLVTWLISL